MTDKNSDQSGQNIEGSQIASSSDDETVRVWPTLDRAIMSSTDLSWTDRSAIVSLAQKRIIAIRNARASTDFFESIKGLGDLGQIADLVNAAAELPDERDPIQSPGELLNTNWIG